ncbi:hypothetical protein ACT4UT_32155, partial [Bacillus sp. B-TM1]
MFLPFTVCVIIEDKDVSIFRAGRGLTKEIVEEISRMK